MTEEIFKTGKAIKALREKQNISRKQLSDLIGSSPAAITETETGKRNSSISVLSRIAKALNCDLVITFKKNKDKAEF